MLYRLLLSETCLLFNLLLLHRGTMVLVSRAFIETSASLQYNEGTWQQQCTSPRSETRKSLRMRETQNRFR